MKDPQATITQGAVPATERTVLVVDDDGPILRALAARLGHVGYQVVATTVPADALCALADGTAPDVAILDINMPGLNGFKLAEKIKAQLPECALVFLTANKASETRSQAEACGPFAYIEKPFDSMHLVDVVGAACAQPQ